MSHDETTEIVTAHPRAIRNPIEKHLIAIREEFTGIDHQTQTLRNVIEGLRRELEVLNTRLLDYQKRYEVAEEKLEKIRGHLT